MGNGKVVYVRDRTLLLKSNVIHDYPWLMALLEKHDNLSEAQVAELPSEHQDFFKHMLNSVLKQASSEWIGNRELPVADLGTEKSDWIPCSLCHHLNRYIFYISNKLNGNELNVGRECVKKFGIDLGRSGATVAQLLKQATKLKRLENLNKEFPNIRKIIDTWQSKLDNYTILPEYLERPYAELGKKAKTFFENYLEKPSDDILNDLRPILFEREKRLGEIESYVLEHQHERFFPTKDIKKWIISNRANDALRMIKDKGLITWGAAHRIMEPSFMNLLAEDFNVFLKDIGLIIDRIDLDQRGYVITSTKREHLYLICKHKDFVLAFGGLIFEEDLIEPMSLTNVVKASKVYDETSMSTIVSYVNHLPYNDGIRVYKHRKDWHETLFTKFNEVVIKVNDRYGIGKLDSFADYFKGIAFGLKTILLKEFVNLTINKLITYDELQDIIDSRKDM